MPSSGGTPPPGSSGADGREGAAGGGGSGTAQAPAAQTAHVPSDRSHGDSASAYHSAALLSSPYAASAPAAGGAFLPVGHKSSGSGGGSHVRVTRPSAASAIGIATVPEAEVRPAAYLLVEATTGVKAGAVRLQIATLLTEHLPHGDEDDDGGASVLSKIGAITEYEDACNDIPAEGSGMTAWKVHLLAEDVAAAARALHRDRDHVHAIGALRWMHVLAFSSQTPPAFVIKATGVAMLDLAHSLEAHLAGVGVAPPPHVRRASDESVGHISAALAALDVSRMDQTNPLTRGWTLRQNLRSPPRPGFLNEVQGHVQDVARAVLGDQGGTALLLAESPVDGVPRSPPPAGWPAKGAGARGSGADPTVTRTPSKASGAGSGGGSGAGSPANVTSGLGVRMGSRHSDASFKSAGSEHPPPAVDVSGFPSRMSAAAAAAPPAWGSPVASGPRGEGWGMGGGGRRTPCVTRCASHWTPFLSWPAAACRRLPCTTGPSVPHGASHR
jgi:hypothetical protein